MAKMTIDKGHFSDRAGAMQDIQQTGYWPHTFVSGASPELPIHRHDHDVIGYVVEGETYMVDEDGEHIPVEAGDRMVIPKGAWHAEGAVVGRVVYIVSFKEPVALKEGIIPRDAKGPFPTAKL
ncbi:MAG TPA: cupin domain-containing protein [Myxococcales bacterium]|nr:cupin domain-containing protein [Myxococcales bacterium]HIM02573.1 cupin domain-containing protein [Myxococcales bacterium]